MANSRTPYTAMADNPAADHKTPAQDLPKFSSSSFFSLPANNGNKVVMAAAATPADAKEKLKARKAGREALAILPKPKANPGTKSPYEQMVAEGNGGVRSFFYASKGTGTLSEFGQSVKNFFQNLRQKKQPMSVQQVIIDTPATPQVGFHAPQLNGNNK